MELEGRISLLSFYFISPLQSAQHVINGRHNLRLVNLCLRSKICKNILVIHVCMNVASIVKKTITHISNCKTNPGPSLITCIKLGVVKFYQIL